MLCWSWCAGYGRGCHGLVVEEAEASSEMEGLRASGGPADRRGPADALRLGDTSVEFVSDQYAFDRSGLEFDLGDVVGWYSALELDGPAVAAGSALAVDE